MYVLSNTFTSIILFDFYHTVDNLVSLSVNVYLLNTYSLPGDMLGLRPSLIKHDFMEFRV